MIILDRIADKLSKFEDVFSRDINALEEDIHYWGTLASIADTKVAQKNRDCLIKPIQEAQSYIIQEYTKVLKLVERGFPHGSHEVGNRVVDDCRCCHRIQVLRSHLLLLLSKASSCMDKRELGVRKWKLMAKEIEAERIDVTCRAEQALVFAEVLRPRNDMTHYKFIRRQLIALDQREPIPTGAAEPLESRFERVRGAMVDSTKKFRALRQILGPYISKLSSAKWDTLRPLATTTALVLALVLTCHLKPATSYQGREGSEYFVDGHECSMTHGLEYAKECFEPNGRDKRSRPPEPTVNSKYPPSCCAAVVVGSNETFKGTFRRVGAVLGLPGLLATVLVFCASFGLLTGALYIVTSFIVAVWTFTRTACYLLAEFGGTVKAWYEKFLGRSLEWANLTSELVESPDIDAVRCFYHMTDLHVFGDRHAPYEIVQRHSHLPKRHAFLRDPLGEFSRIISAVATDSLTSGSPKALLITGDITDSGSAFDWIKLIRAARNCSPDLDIYLVPGNHDVAFNPSGDPDVDGYKFRRRHILWRLMLECMPETWRRDPPLFTVPLSCGAAHHVITMITLDSCRYPSRHMGSNAFGHIGENQLRQLEHELGGANGPVVIGMHHHLIGFREIAEGFATSVRDARSLVRVAREYCSRDKNNDLLVIHGHQHMRYMRQAQCHLGGRFTVYCGPSSTMGASDGKGVLDGVSRYALVWYSRDRGFRVQENVVPPLVSSALRKRPGPVHACEQETEAHKRELGRRQGQGRVDRGRRQRPQRSRRGAARRPSRRTATGRGGGSRRRA